MSSTFGEPRKVTECFHALYLLILPADFSEGRAAIALRPGLRMGPLRLIFYGSQLAEEVGCFLELYADSSLSSFPLEQAYKGSSAASCGPDAVSWQAAKEVGGWEPPPISSLEDKWLRGHRGLAGPRLAWGPSPASLSSVHFENSSYTGGGSLVEKIRGQRLSKLLPLPLTA